MSDRYSGQPLLADPVPAGEPALSRAGLVALATAVVSLLVAFGVPLTGDQRSAILGLVAVVAPIVAGVAARSRVFSPATVKRLLGERP